MFTAAGHREARYLRMKRTIFAGILALMILLLALPGVVSAADLNVEGSILPSAPVAAFSASPLVGVAPLSVTFTDTSTPVGYIDTWKWECNAGSGWVQFSTAQNPTYPDFVAGAYDIRLTVSNSGGSNAVTKTHYIAVATGREPLVTVQSGTVTGDLYVESPTTYATGVTEVTKTFTLPPESVGNIQWAKLYVNTYSGSAANTYALTSTVKLGGTPLGVETMDIASETNGNSYPLNDHVNKVYSDYEAQYDVTTLISSANPVVNVKSEAISGKSFDGRIKGVTLVVAYNNPASTTQTKYWVNHGGDWSNPGSGSTIFDTTVLTSGWVSAESKIRQFSSSDATTYTFNGVSKTPGGSTPSYNGLNTWDVTSDINAGSSSTLEYIKSASFKTTLATLKVKYAAPTADFSATPLSVDKNLPVAFTDASSGSITSYVWNFGDGATSTDKNPSHTYTTTGKKTVALTVTGPTGTNTKTVTDMITVKEPAPVIDFTPTSASGPRPLTVNFAGTNTGGSVTSWAWDFGDGTGTGQTITHTYQSAGTYTVTLTATGPDYTDIETKTNIISVGDSSIAVTVTDASIPFGTMAAGDTKTGSTTVNVDVSGGTTWSVKAADNDAVTKGFMATATDVKLANAFQLSNDGTTFNPMTSDITDFLTGATGVDGSGTAYVKQLIGADAPGAYSITLTFTGGFN
jgi:PKD repeat protein